MGGEGPALAVCEARQGFRTLERRDRRAAAAHLQRVVDRPAKHITRQQERGRHRHAQLVEGPGVFVLFWGGMGLLFQGCRESG